MKILLDTHVFLWFITGDPRLSPVFRDAIQDSQNEVFLSVVSVWEAIIKYQTGKLPLPEPPEKLLPRQRLAHRISSLIVEEAAVQRLAQLPAHHRDPFDRLLICQALEHGCSLATVDDQIKRYAVPLV